MLQMPVTTGTDDQKMVMDWFILTELWKSFFLSVLFLLLNQFNRCLSEDWNGMRHDMPNDWKDMQGVVDEMNKYADFPRPSVEDYLNGMKANVFYDFFYDS